MIFEKRHVEKKILEKMTGENSNGASFKRQSSKKAYGYVPPVIG